MRAIIGTLIFTILAPGLVTVAVPYLLLSSGVGFSYDIGYFMFIGVIPLIVGIAFYIWTALDFVIAGGGTPAPVDPPRMLVSGGLYRIVRNPMYVGVWLVLIGEAIFFASVTLLAYALFVWLLFHLFVVYYEEPNLRRRFGAAYEEYCRAVPRWIPKLKHARGGGF